jgi:AcrR family transcriptional regulator
MEQLKKEKSTGSTFSSASSYKGKNSGSSRSEIFMPDSNVFDNKNTTADNEEKEKILSFAREIFLKEGFYKTTMDEIAAKLHVSKKTIYKYFSSKEELVRDVITTHMQSVIKKIKGSINNQSNAVEKLFDIFTIVGQNILKVNEKMIMDLQSYSPRLWKEVDDFRARQITRNFTKIFEQGKAEGYFLDIKTEIILSIFISSIRAIVNPDYVLSTGVSLKEAFSVIIEILMNGIMNDKGKKIFNKLKNGVTK